MVISPPSQPVTPASVLARINARINVEHDFTRGDEIILTLHGLVTCPILLEPSHDMIIFNNHCYDKESFLHYKQGEMRRNERRIASGYHGQTRLKDPRTGTNFNYTIAMHRHYYETISSEKLALMFLSRIANLTEGKCRHFIPNVESFEVNTIVMHVRTLYSDRENKYPYVSREVASASKDCSGIITGYSKYSKYFQC